MTDAGCNDRADNVTDRALVTEEQLGLQSAIRQVRICRSTLGAILDVLETVNIPQDRVGEVTEGSLNVMAEIEQLWDSLKAAELLAPST